VDLAASRAAQPGAELAGALSLLLEGPAIHLDSRLDDLARGGAGNEHVIRHRGALMPGMSADQAGERYWRAMAQDNVETLRSLIDAFNRTDVEAVLGLFTEDCAIEEPPQMPDSPVKGYRGHEGVREWMGNLRGVGGVSFELESTAPLGGALLGELKSRALGRGSDMPIEWRTFAVFELRDDKIARIRVFLSREEAVAG
jgi:ketosteroid isomerase-like protein